MKDIGLNHVLDQLRIMTPYGREQLQAVKPYSIDRLSNLKRVLEDQELMISSLSASPQIYDHIEREFCRIKDIKGSIKRCKNQGVLDDIELFEIKLFAIYGENIRKHYESLDLSIEDVCFQDLEPVIDLLDPEKKRFATFSIYDAYSDELKKAREKKRDIEKLLYNENDSERSEELKQERSKLVEEEEQLEGEIRIHLSQQLQQYGERLEENVISIGLLDLYTAKARLAIEKGCSKPLFQEGIQLEMVRGRHPYIEDLLQEEGKTITPINIDLKAGTNAITGPNMGGKSVTLRTIALNALLAHMGFFVFADTLRLSCFDFIHLLADHLESIKGGLSTFGGEIVKFNEYMKDIKRSRGLVLIDEFASGTNPYEGKLLVKSLMEYLQRFNTISVFITHFDGVVGAGVNHYRVIGLKHVNFNELIDQGNNDSKYRLKLIQSLMDYRLEPVENEENVPKDGLNIATLLGLDSEIIEIAKAHYLKEVQFCGKETEKDA
ncbi:lysine 5,6-aminomutase reactivase ATPase KamC [Alkaliphilus hydrothermalis]|uniref:DsDNA-specific endonuclease/ATPase MutS2 n=1 Tax=Alkaliphilus hydrothermalis TaxID=1482730 RepID=A0ABS2NTS0_9FIRM|nr:hypothetical protein [Alkaliphilus hydrothermalis]MBM7616257.1 dsDNA-specific endonuclease/ATPase MutS2 [Alkaliphilus hydrothermalis]